MKTVQIVPAMEQGGVERGVVEVNRALVANGWENVVVSAGGRLVEQIVADGGRHIELDVKSKNPFTYLWRARKLRKVLERERPDAVCAHSRVPAWLFVRANSWLGIPWISFAHGANSVSRYSAVMTRGDLVVAPSNFIAEYLKRSYGISGEKIRVIPRAIDRDRFNVDSLDHGFMAAKREEWGIDGKFVVMGLGRITQLKGYDTLIRAVNEANMMRQRDIMPTGAVQKPYKLVIVGEAEALRKEVENDLRLLVKAMGMDKSVVFAGNQRKVAECLALADVVVSSNTKKPEAFGRSMAEALAMGRPVVAKAFGGALDIVEDGVNGALVPANVPSGEMEVAAFAKAIQQVAHTKFGDLRAAALDKFSFELMARRTIAAYEELVGAKSRQHRTMGLSG